MSTNYTPSQPTLHVFASLQSDGGSYWAAYLYHADARELAAAAPKVIKLRPSSITAPADGESYLNGSTTYPMGSFNATLSSTGRNGAKNETGLKRVRRLLAYAEAQGWTVVYNGGYSNAFPTLDAALAAAAK